MQGLLGGEGYTVPPGFVAVLRDVDVYWGGGLAFPSVHVIGSASQTIAEFHPTADANAGLGAQADSHTWRWRGRQVVEPGDSFGVNVTGDPCDVSVSGYLLTYVPPSGP